jgi:hypothetical protein
MSRGGQIGILTALLVLFLVGISLLPAKAPPSAAIPPPTPTTPPAATPVPAAANNPVATAIGNASLATAIGGVDRSRLSTAIAGVDRNQAATAVSISGLLQPGTCLNIKAVVQPNGAKIYYLPESYYYESAQVNKGNGGRFFCTAAEALVAGFAPGP